MESDGIGSDGPDKKNNFIFLINGITIHENMTYNETGMTNQYDISCHELFKVFMMKTLCWNVGY